MWLTLYIAVLAPMPLPFICIIWKAWMKLLGSGIPSGSGMLQNNIKQIISYSIASPSRSHHCMGRISHCLSLQNTMLKNQGTGLVVATSMRSDTYHFHWPPILSQFIFVIEFEFVANVGIFQCSRCNILD